MFEGDMDEGELEIGQIAALIKEVKPAAEIVREIIDEFKSTGGFNDEVDLTYASIISLVAAKKL